MAPQLTPRKGFFARGPGLVDRARDHLLARAALAGDEQRDVRVLHAIDEGVEPPHRGARADEARVAEVAAELGAHLPQVAPRLGELLGALAEHPRQLVARAREGDVGARQLVGARQVLGEEARVLDRDGRLVGEGARAWAARRSKRTPGRRRVST